MTTDSLMFMKVEQKSGTLIAGGAINTEYDGWFQIEQVSFGASFGCDVTLAANNAVLSRPSLSAVSVYVPTSNKKNTLAELSRKGTRVKEVVIHQLVQVGSSDNETTGSEILAEIHLGWSRITQCSGNTGYQLTFEPREFVYVRNKLAPETKYSEGAAGLAGYNTLTQKFISELDTDGTAPTAPTAT